MLGVVLRFLLPRGEIFLAIINSLIKKGKKRFSSSHKKLELVLYEPSEEEKEGLVVDVY